MPEKAVATGSPLTLRTGVRPESLRDSRNVKGEGPLTDPSAAELTELFALQKEVVARWNPQA